MSRITLFLILLISVTFWQCEKNLPKAETPHAADIERLIIGHYYGMCIGPTCIENYLLEDGKLYVDSKNEYGKEFPYIGDWTERPAADYAIAAPLLESFPTEIWQADQQTFGIPDAYDQGGFFIEAKHKDGTHRAWNLDTNRDALPEYLRPFAEQLATVLNTLEE